MMTLRGGAGDSGNQHRLHDLAIVWKRTRGTSVLLTGTWLRDRFWNQSVSQVSNNRLMVRVQPSRRWLLASAPAWEGMSLPLDGGSEFSSLAVSLEVSLCT